MKFYTVKSIDTYLKIKISPTPQKFQTLKAAAL